MGGEGSFSLRRGGKHALFVRRWHCTAKPDPVQPGRDRAQLRSIGRYDTVWLGLGLCVGARDGVDCTQVTESCFHVFT
jgi:hypothetical protein